MIFYACYVKLFDYYGWTVYAGNNVALYDNRGEMRVTNGNV